MSAIGEITETRRAGIMLTIMTATAFATICKPAIRWLKTIAIPTA
jgi:hypothetical protein